MKLNKGKDKRPPLSSNAKKYISRITSFKELKKNWDSYNANPPGEKAIMNAIRFIKMMDELNIPVYFTAPGPDGEVLVEIKMDQNTVEVYFDSDGSNELRLLKTFQ